MKQIHLKKLKVEKGKNKIKKTGKKTNPKIINKNNANNDMDIKEDSNNQNEYDSNDEEDKNDNIKDKKSRKKMNKFKEENNDNINMDNNTKVIIMYFIYLVEYYMKKKVFSLYASKIANYQKYLEKKFALKILYRLIKKRIIFYKIKFLHRYKKIYKYLYKNNIETITQVYSEQSSSYFFSENNTNNNKIIPKNIKTERKNILKENKNTKIKTNKNNISKNGNNKENKGKNLNKNTNKVKTKK